MMSQFILPLQHWGSRNSYGIIRSVFISFSILTLWMAQSNDIMRKRPIMVTNVMKGYDNNVGTLENPWRNKKICVFSESALLP